MKPDGVGRPVASEREARPSGLAMCGIALGMMVVLAGFAGCITTGTAAGDSGGALENGTYYLEGTPVSLRSGLYEGKEGAVRLGPLVAYGDLNGDQTNDAAVILYTQPKGSDLILTDLAAVLSPGRSFRYVDAVPLGDRVKVETLEIKNRVIEVGFLTHGLNQSPGRPTLREMERYRIEGGRLMFVP